MKKVIKGVCWVLLCPFLLIACTKNSEVPSTSPATVDNPSSNLVAGQWVISSYFQKTEDKTAQFAGITFIFSQGGQLTATQNGEVTTGTWSFSPSSVGYYGGTPTKASMTISLGTGKALKNLSRTWNVLSTETSKLSLINPEPQEGENLVFSKQ
jgi:hypothetical protein